MEDLVTFEIAKKLKEKGFREECLLHYTDTGYLFCNSIDTYDRPNQELDYSDFRKCFNNGNSIGLVDAPTISQVLKWLRKEKDIDIVISPVFFYDGVLGKMREYGCKVFTPSLNKPEHCGYQEEWEQAAIAGIEYALDNFI